MKLYEILKDTGISFDFPDTEIKDICYDSEGREGYGVCLPERSRAGRT